MTEQPATPEPPRPMPQLGKGVHWSDVVAEIERDHRARTRDAEPPAPNLGAAGSSLGDRLRTPAELRELDAALATGGVVFPKTDGDVIPLPVSRCLYEQPRAVPPPVTELRAMADDLNAHGGLGETFVAELLRQAADPFADAKRQLGIVDTPPPVTTTEPITFESIVEALEKIAPLGPQRLDVVKLTQEQVDAVTASQPHVAPNAEPWRYFGTPVEIVATVEESTPYQLANAEPGGIVEIHGELSDAEFETLRADWLRAFDAKPRLSRWIVEPRARVVPFGGPFRPLADVLDEQPAPARRPWWRRTLDRVLRRPR